MTDDLVKRLADIDPILDAEFDTQLNVRRDPYGATRAIEMALYLLRDQADRIEALTAERDRAIDDARDNAEYVDLVSQFRAERDAAVADNARLRGALDAIVDEYDGQMHGPILHTINEARAALDTGKEVMPLDAGTTETQTQAHDIGPGDQAVAGAAQKGNSHE